MTWALSFFSMLMRTSDVDKGLNAKALRTNYLFCVLKESLRPEPRPNITDVGP